MKWKIRVTKDRHTTLQCFKDGIQIHFGIECNNEVTKYRCTTRNCFKDKKGRKSSLLVVFGFCSLLAVVAQGHVVSVLVC